ncbi:MAG TPA: glycosyltransferase family 2 protein [Alphaproteobacteria bacterium]|nr:glycosyltransferase family 2 protein [Alphaproteobacteria bacterium]
MARKSKFSKDIVISVVAPVYNEEQGITDFIAQVFSVLKKMDINHEVILVNDGSRDRTLQTIERQMKQYKNLRLIDLSRNYGREIAMTAGLDQSVGDYVVLMDSDLQDPPALIPQLLDKLLAENLDTVYAARSSREGESFLKKFSSKIFYRVASRVSGMSIPDNAGDYRVMSRRVVNAINSMKEHNRYLKMLYAYVGFKTGYVTFDRAARTSGTSSYNWVKLINAALDAIFAFSSKPLRWMSLISVGISLLLMSYAGMVLVSKIIGNHTVEGWSSLMFMVSLMFSILFLFLSVLSEYIGRILTESKNRPLYYLREENGSVHFQSQSIIQHDDSRR